jgi:hypothetical protein
LLSSSSSFKNVCAKKQQHVNISRAFGCYTFSSLSF